MAEAQNKSEVEIIPLTNTPSSKSSPQLPNSSMQKSLYFGDPMIVSRIERYLDGKPNAHFIDVTLMADDLQKIYAKDYGKRKRSAFRCLVKKVYSSLLKHYGENYDTSSFDSGEEMNPNDNDTSIMSQHLLDMYTRNMQSVKAKPLEHNELIDLSSDDSECDYPTKLNPYPINGASTSVRGEKRINMLDDEDISNADASLTDKQKKRKMEEAAMATPTTKKKRPAQMIDAHACKSTFKDIGGMDKVLEHVCQLLVHMKHPEVYRQLGISPPRGFLLHGPPGCGKTLLAHCIAGELALPLLKVAAPELVAGVSGESEERIRDLFERATGAAPCILFIDEIDAITQNRQFAQKDMERRIVAQMLTCLDDLNKNEHGDQVLVIGATNRPDALDPALRRAGRFDREVSLGIPDAASRLNILTVLTSKLRLEEGFNFQTLAKFTPGYVGADLMALTREAAMVAVNRVFNEIKAKKRLERVMAEQKASADKQDKSSNEAEIVVEPSSDESPSKADDDDSNAVVVVDDDSLKKGAELQVPSKESGPEMEKFDNLTPRDAGQELTPLDELICWLHNDAPLNAEQLKTLFITSDDFSKALKLVQPSAKREGFATVPDVTWDDVGSLTDIREELQLTILAPVRHAEQFQSLGITTPTGVLLCGPPGCGKTLLAKAIANEAGINFISVKGPELLNMYVGESERAVRLCFERARNSAPCVIFFDELDALCPKRSDSREGGATMRVVNQMLTEMDGVESRSGVFLLAASNRPDIIDPAVLRPGRLDKILYVGLPTAQDRVDILRTITKNGTRPHLDDAVDLEIIGNSGECEGYTGADLAALVREASVRALQEIILQGDVDKPLIVTTEHFKHAVEKIRPSVSEKDKQHYTKLRKIYSARQQDVEEMEYS